MQKKSLPNSNTTRCITINLEHRSQNNWLVLHVVLAVCCAFQIPVHVPQKHTAVIMPSIGFTSKEPNNSFYSRTGMACYRTKAFCEEKSWANQFYAQLSLFPGRQLIMCVCQFTTSALFQKAVLLGMTRWCCSSWFIICMAFWEKNFTAILFELAFIVSVPINMGYLSTRFLLGHFWWWPELEWSGHEQKGRSYSAGKRLIMNDFRANILI